MILKGNFYEIEKLDAAGTSIRGSLLLNPAHEIFTGHFPGMPVVPGVCMMQIVKEIVETVSGKKTRIGKADSLKFLQVINPYNNGRLDFNIIWSVSAGAMVQVSADLLADEAVCFKFKGILSCIE